MSQGDSSERRLLTRKELARELRRQAYERAKKQRAKDPRVIAMKEAAKVRRREAYQKAKAQRQTAAAAAKCAAKQEHRVKTTEARVARDNELMKLIAFTAKGSTAQN